MINGCNNRPRPVAGAPIVVQDGYVSSWGSGFNNPQRQPRWTTAPFRMSTDCQYDASARDPGCAGCEHAPHLREVAP